MELPITDLIIVAVSKLIDDAQVEPKRAKPMGSDSIEKELNQ